MITQYINKLIYPKKENTKLPNRALYFLFAVLDK